MEKNNLQVGTVSPGLMGSAVVLTNGLLTQTDAKTAHGLIRGTDRFDILAVIDENSAGQDAGVVLDGVQRNIPVFASVEGFMKTTGKKPDYAIIGVAVSGGKLDEVWQAMLLEVINMGISIVNGLHMFLGDIRVFANAAETNKVSLIDFRKSKTFDQLHHWSGRIYGIKTPRLAILGTDCALGKRTTCKMLLDMCRSNGIRSEMIFTGQTGWLQGYPYGFILDATPNDFVSGELESAIVDCAQEASPDLMLVEGQSALRNPVGPCGTEFILSGNINGIVLQHAPFRKYFDTTESYGCLLPSLEDEIKLIEMFGARVIAVTLNGEGGTNEELAQYTQKMNKKTGLPVIRPLEDDISVLLPVIKRFIQDFDQYAPTTRLEPVLA